MIESVLRYVAIASMIIMGVLVATWTLAVIFG